MLTGHHVRTDRVDVASRTAGLAVRIEATRLEQDLRPVADVELIHPNGKITSLTVPLAAAGPAERALSGAATVQVEDAELWWTHDLGAQPRYQVTIRLRDGEQLLDERRDQIGLRTIALDRSEDPEGGRHFRFVLNGVPIFARGAAWLPADMLVGSVSEARYRELLSTARDGQMTMLRIWGGGIYENDAFYTVCDELGLLVWQDFLFACMDYPDDDLGLRAEVEQEAAHQVRRLRNHACLALWCGNNEVQMIHVMGYHDLAPGDWGSAFFDEVQPAGRGGRPRRGRAVLARQPVRRAGRRRRRRRGDQRRARWRQTCLGGLARHGLRCRRPANSHPRRSRCSIRRYADGPGKFISEFGIHASPELPPWNGGCPTEQLHVDSPDVRPAQQDIRRTRTDLLWRPRPDGRSQLPSSTSTSP